MFRWRTGKRPSVIDTETATLRVVSSLSEIARADWDACANPASIVAGNGTAPADCARPTGVAPVTGLDGAGKVIYGPDLSIESQSPDLTNLDTYGHGTFMAGLIAQ